MSRPLFCLLACKHLALLNGAAHAKAYFSVCLRGGGVEKPPKKPHAHTHTRSRNVEVRSAKWCEFQYFVSAEKREQSLRLSSSTQRPATTAAALSERLLFQCVQQIILPLLDLNLDAAVARLNPDGSRLTLHLVIWGSLCGFNVTTVFHDPLFFYLFTRYQTYLCKGKQIEDRKLLWALKKKSWVCNDNIFWPSEHLITSFLWRYKTGFCEYKQHPTSMCCWEGREDFWDFLIRRGPIVLRLCLKDADEIEAKQSISNVLWD